MAHIVLLGDSIFDNAAYVPDGLPVIDQVRVWMEEGDRATLLAIDGDCIRDVSRQLTQLPKDATHLFLSIGGNDALGYASVLRDAATSLPIALQQIADMKKTFSQAYQKLLKSLLALDLPLALCTIYDACPVPDPTLQLLATTALSVFNDCITRQAIAQGLPLIDLRVLCSDPADYSSVSPIEPSTTGGEKIARCIATIVKQHNFSQNHTTCYVQYST